MKNDNAIKSVSHSLTCYLFVFVALTVPAVAQNSQPKVDTNDLVLEELGCYGNKFNETPQRDQPHFPGRKSDEATRDVDWKLISFRDKVKSRQPSPPLLTEPKELYFADDFSPGEVSSRWFFSKDWSAENGMLIRGKTGSKNTRIFIKDPKFRDVLIRFDFQMQQANDIRLMTGSGGNYNAVIHIRKDHFYIQTALDKTGPYYPYRHGECAFDFDSDKWYTMTVEFLGNQLVAHLDHDHLAYAQHPILDQSRMYFAFQVDENPAAFDNVQILTAVRKDDEGRGADMIKSASGKYPVSKTLVEQYQIQKTNAHEWLYQRDEKYRKIIKRLAELDEKNKKRYPNVFRTHKNFSQERINLRKKLLTEDPAYKETLFATYRAERALEAFLISLKPEVAKLHNSRKKREIERLRTQYKTDQRYLELLRSRNIAQQKLESTYPQLFRTDADVTEFRDQERNKLKNDPEFRKHVDDRAAVWRDQQDYLLTHNDKLARLKQKLDSAP